MFQLMATAYLQVCTTSLQISTDSYLLHSSSHPSHVKKTATRIVNFLVFDVYCSNASDFSYKSEEMCLFFKERGYPADATVVNTLGQQRVQRTD